jgi:type II secretory pathway pseudopilin PulG
MRRKDRPGQRRDAFTLIELGIVILIIGLLITFILTASYAGVQRAQARATQALIAKLENGVNDRIAALLSTHVQPNGAHQFLAAIFPPGSSPGSAPLPWGLAGEQRAQVIAQMDYMKRELPDVFFVQVDPTALPTASGSSAQGIYPLNFAGLPYAPNSMVPSATPTLAFRLPLGHHGTLYAPNTFNASGQPINPGPGDGQLPTDTGDGIYGASYPAVAGVYKGLGYQPTGYDGLDNDGDGFTDDWNEGIFGLTPAQVQVITTRLINHRHVTARAETLYAVLVEGRGPLGSVFVPDDFNEREVQDTDGDGMPEFVDSWGQPLQFYRWPIAYNSDVQKGLAGYINMQETREQDPLDPSQQLVAPSWWLAAINQNSFFGNSPGVGMSSAAWTFAQFFHNIVDPNPTGGTPGTLWDRSNSSVRRAFFSKFLIASAGPDNLLGIAQFGVDYSAGVDADTGPLPTPTGVAFPSGSPPLNAAFTSPNSAQANQYALGLLLVENTAASLSPFRDTTQPTCPVTGGNQAGSIGLILNKWGQDDITNQKLSTPGMGLQ